MKKNSYLFIVGTILFLAAVQYWYVYDGANRIVVAVIGYIVAAIFMLSSGMGLRDIGLPRQFLRRTFWLSVVLVMLIFSVTLLLYLLVPDVFKDERYNQTVGALLKAVLLYLPFSVVVFEEVIFRGVVLGYLLKSESRKVAIVISSVLFGLWHIPTASSFSVDIGIQLPQLVITAAIIAFTSVAGWVFCELRLRGRSLLLPIAVHWSVNAAGMIFALLAWKFA